MVGKSGIAKLSSIFEKKDKIEIGKQLDKSCYVFLRKENCSRLKIGWDYTGKKMEELKKLPKLGRLVGRNANIRREGNGSREERVMVMSE